MHKYKEFGHEFSKKPYTRQKFYKSDTQKFQYFSKNK